MRSIYTKQDGTLYGDREVAIIERVLEGLLDGRYFYLISNSARSALGYRPPTTRREYAHVILTLSRFAAESDALAQLVSGVIGTLPLYQTPPELRAKLAEGVAHKLADGWDDVHGRTGPEPIRHSDAQKQFSLSQRVFLAYMMAEADAGNRPDSVPGVGWCLDAIARANNVHVWTHLTPLLEQARKRNEEIAAKRKR